jgi:uncharacterized DUF497 family protein
MADLAFKGFDWDEGNGTKNLAKHGVSKKVIEAFFANSPTTSQDPKHSQKEQRYLAVGLSSGGRWMLVSYTLRTKAGVRLVRPISARYMHAREVKDYEKADQEQSQD